MKKSLWAPFFLTFLIAQDNNLLFSEYAEGTGNNKYLEIYNGTGSDVDLANYAIVRYNNGSTTNENLYPLSGTLTNGEVYIIANDQADPTGILPYNDDNGSSMTVTFYNGNDYLGLIQDSNNDGVFDNSSEVIDVIGVLGEDPASGGWDVAGTSAATAEHTLIRKSTITIGNTNWSASAGNTTDNSEWIVLAQNTWDYIDSHPHPELESTDPAISITNPTAGATLYSSDVTVSFIVSNFTVATSGGDGHIHYSFDGGSTVMQYNVNDIELENLAETSHVLIIWLVDNSHSNLDPHVADTVSFTVSAPLNYITIAEARAQAVGTNATVRGIVTTPNFQTDNTEYGLQDNSGGLVIFHFGEPYASLAVGDSVEVSGTLLEYMGKFEIEPASDDDITIISQNNPLPAFQAITVASLVANGEDYESELIRINGASITSGTWPTSQSTNLDISDDGGTSTVAMRIDSDMDIIGNPAPAAPFDVQGIAGQYTTYQILPRYYTDFTPATDVVEAPELVINEFLAATELCCDDGTGEIEGFIEIYNPGDEAVDIGGLWITDNLADTSNWEQIPTTDSTTTTVAAGGFIVIWADKDQDSQGILHTADIKLAADGEEIGLIFISGADTIFVDSLSFGAQTDDISYGRHPDGSANWEFFSTPTPGAANQMDSVTITSIYDIQYVADPTTNDTSALNGQEVTISGIVTTEFWGGGNSHLYVQDSDSGWSGIIVYQSGGWDNFNFSSPQGTVNSVAEGDSVTLTGTVNEYYNLTQIKDVTAFMIHGPAAVMIPPTVVTPGQIMTGGTDAEKYESCLIKVVDVTVNDPDLGYGEWSVSDWTNSVRVDDRWDYYYWPDSLQELAEVVGCLDYSFGNTKIQPRLARDVVISSGWGQNQLTRIQRVQQVLYSDLIKAGIDEESDMSYMYGDTVTIEGIVTMPTGLSYAGNGVKFIFQDEHGGPWSSILSYDPDSSAFPILFEGDRVQCTGYVYEYSTGPANMTELFITEPVNIIGVGAVLPDTADVNTGDLRWPTEAEQWGTVMVRATDAIVIENDLPYGEWSIDDGTGKVNVDDDSDSISVWQEDVGRPPVGSYVSSIRGWVYHHYGSNADSTAYKIEPLYVADIEFGAGPPNIMDVSRDPCVPGVDDMVNFSANIVDNSTISEASVYYRMNDGDWNIVAMTNTTGDTWSGSISPSSTDGAFIEYFIKAADDGLDQSEIKWSEFPDTDNGNYLGYNTSSSALTINNIQHSPWPNGESPYNGCDVTVTGIVTADTAQYNSGYGAYAFQSASAQWNGIIFDGWDDSMLSRGDEVTVSGTVEEFDPEYHFKYDGNTKLINVSAVTVNSAGNTMAPMSVSTVDLAQDGEEVESYEGCLVTVSNVTVSAVNAYDWGIVDDSGVECLIDDDMATMAADNYLSTLENGSTLGQVTGIFNFSFGTYKIQVRDLADLGQLGVDEDFESLPRRFALYDNFPNPFNPETRIRFEIANQENVQLIIYDMLGRKVRTLVNDNYNPGMYVINWDGMNDNRQPVSSGPYLYRIKAGEFIDHKKMILVR